MMCRVRPLMVTESEPSRTFSRTDFVSSSWAWSWSK